jgi:hypothetical protein
MATMAMEQSSSLLAEYTAYLAGKNPRTVENTLGCSQAYLP